MSYQTLVKHLEKDCLLARINCPHSCGEVIVRKDIESHCIEECKKLEVECPDCKVAYRVYSPIDHECKIPDIVIPKIVENLEVECPDCKVAYRLENLIDHECKIREIVIPQIVENLEVKELISLDGNLDKIP